MIELDAYYTGIVDQVFSAKTAWEAGVRDSSYEETAAQVAQIHFGNEFAQAWWQQSRLTWMSPSTVSFRTAMDEAIGSTGTKDSQNFYDAIQRDLK